jgi:hypothetical protein
VCKGDRQHGKCGGNGKPERREKQSMCHHSGDSALFLAPQMVRKCLLQSQKGAQAAIDL